MAGKSTRNKGRRGESEAKRLLVEKDWEILADMTAGLATGDLIAQSPDGVIYDVEVKVDELELVGDPAVIEQILRTLL